MGLILAGIDEAGYGPLLGPLTVGMSVFRVRDWADGQPAPDCWKLLKSAVARKPGGKRPRIPVADSKKLKLPNDGPKRHPLTHLERAVLAFLHQTGSTPWTDSDLLAALGATHTGRAWYAGDAARIPVAAPSTQPVFDANMLRTCMAAAGVELIALRCIAVDETAFNDIVRQTGTKGEATLHAIGRHLRWLRDDLHSRAIDDPVRVVCDRLGGRTTYGDLLERELPGHYVRATEEGPLVSRYEVGERWAALFQPEAEDAHMPVALASMTAKLVRELAMARFNRHFLARKPDLKPTAGYRGDAQRWLRDASAILTPDERREMVRIA